jgi:hypothetical protein
MAWRSSMLIFLASKCTYPMTLALPQDDRTPHVGAAAGEQDSNDDDLDRLTTFFASGI